MNLYPKLVRNLLYPLVLWRRGDWAERDHLREFERSQYLPAAEIRDLQWRRLHVLLDFAYRNCPFYRERFERAGLMPSDLQRLEDLVRLPALEKHEIQQHRDRLVAENWPGEDRIPNQTGGSTGQPLSFFLSKSRKQTRAAATIRHNRWAGWDIGDKVAYLWGAPQDLPRAGLWTTLRTRLVDRQLFLDTGCITEERMRDFNVQLKHFRPRVIVAYARAATLFARYVRANGLSTYQPRSIVTSAEVLEPEDRRLLQEVFSCPVFNRYGCREVSVIASECPAHNGLHTMAEGLLVEVVKGDRLAQPGETGAILVTDLLNFAMPLIRYRIGDMGAWASGDCACGRGLPRLKHVAGRVTDMVVGPDGRLVSGVFLATYVIAQRPSLGQVQIRQHEPGVLCYRVKPGPDFRSSDDIDYLTRATRQHLGEQARVAVELVDDLPCEPSGKFLFCRSDVAPDYIRAGSGASKPGE
jgi:phenylacetate-coenzyme A ligase PaaK-like adenylate-forming protein